MGYLIYHQPPQYGCRDGLHSCTACGLELDGDDMTALCGECE